MSFQRGDIFVIERPFHDQEFVENGGKMLPVFARAVLPDVQLFERLEGDVRQRRRKKRPKTDPADTEKQA